MATELLPIADTGTGSSTSKKNGGEAPQRAQVVGYTDNLLPGRRENPATYPEGPGKGERRVQSERQPASEVQAIYEKFAVDFRDDISQLIEMRKRRNSTQKFHDFLRDSGHSYYIDYFTKLTEAQEGTAGRADGGNIQINEAEFKKFKNDPASMAKIYKIQQQELLEQSMAAAAAFSENPASPSPGMIEPTSTTLVEGGPIRELAREVGNWWGKARGRPGNRGDGYTNRAARITMGTNGRLTLSIAGLNLSMGALGAGVGSLGGPVGAAAGGILGLVGAEGTAALFEAMKKGVRQDLDISPAALQTLIGDPKSARPENRTANQAQIQWMREKNNLNPDDYEVVDGQVRRKDGIVGMTGIDKEKLAKILSGKAKNLMDFQAADGIPPEHRQVMDPSWIFEGTINRPQQGTEIERKLFAQFQPDRGGIRDIHGNFILENLPVRGADIPVAQRTVGPGGENADYPQDAYFNLTPNTPLPEGLVIPTHNNAAGDPVPQHISTTGEQVNIPMTGPRLFRVGDPIPAGTLIPSYTRQRNIPPRVRLGRLRRAQVTITETIPAEVVAAARPADREFNGLQHFGRNAAIPAGTVIPEHLGPGPIILDAARNPVMREQVNPDFDRNQLDGIGNARRWLEAVEAVLESESTDICQSLVDGETKYNDRTFERFRTEKEASKDTVRIATEKEKITKRQAGLNTDKTKLAAQTTDIEEYLQGTQGIRDKIAEAERAKKAEEKKVTITLSGGRKKKPTVEEALAIVNTDNRTVTVTIDGESITAIGAQREKLKTAIKANYDRYRKETAVDSLKTKSEAARKIARTKATQLQTLSENPRLTADQLLQFRLQTLSVQSSTAEQNAQELESAYTAAQAKASEYYDELVRDPKDEDIRAIKADIKRQEEIVKKALDSIREKGEIVETQTKALSGTDAEKRAEAAGVFSSMIDARRDMLRWGITDNDLQTKTFEELLTIINQKNSANPAEGWPKTGNNSEPNRLKLFNGKAEALAAGINPAVRNPSTDFQAAIDANVWRLTEVDLLNLSTDAIKKRMTDRSGAIARVVPSDSDIDDIRDEAAERLKARQQMLQQVEGDVDHMIHTEEDSLKRIDTEGILTPKVDAVLRASTRYDAINTDMTEHLPEDEDVTRFLGVGRTSREPITPTNLPPRVDIEAEQFYENALREVFGTDTDTSAYYNGEEGTKAALERAKVTFPRKDFFDLVQRRFRLTVSGGNTQIPPTPPPPAPPPATFRTLNREQAIINELLKIDNKTLRVGLADLLTEGVLYNYLANIKI